jgi:PAS domain S-box-containing protein
VSAPTRDPARPDPTGVDDLTLAELRTMLGSSPDAAVVVGPDGAIRIVNRAAEEMFGYGPEALHGLPVEVLVPSSVRDEHTRMRDRYALGQWRRAMGAGKPLTALRRDGTEFPVDISLAPVMLEREPVVLAAVRDASQHRLMAAQLTWLAGLLDLTLDAVTVYDPRTLHREFVNQALVDLTGFSREDLLEQRGNRWTDDPAVRAALEPVLSGSADKMDVEEDLPTADGGTVPVVSRITLREHDSGDRLVVAVSRRR